MSRNYLKVNQIYIIGVLQEEITEKNNVKVIKIIKIRVLEASYWKGHFVLHKTTLNHRWKIVESKYVFTERKKKPLRVQEKWLYHYIRERKSDFHETFWQQCFMPKKQWSVIFKIIMERKCELWRLPPAGRLLRMCQKSGNIISVISSWRI